MRKIITTTFVTLDGVMQTPEGSKAENFKLVDSKIGSTGIIFAIYEPTGELKTSTI